MDAFDALGDAALRETLLFVRGRPAPVTADEAAAALSIHRTVARGRLERLLRAGLVEARFERRSGRAGPGAGRPAKLYAPAPHRRALEFPPRRLATIVRRLVDELPADNRDEALARVGAAYGRDVAASAGLRAATDPARGLEAVCAGLRGVGFPASLSRAAAGQAVITTPDCPLRPLVREHPVSAAIDRAMWAALVEAGVGGVVASGLRCETHGCRGAGVCTVTISFDAPT